MISWVIKKITERKHKKRIAKLKEGAVEVSKEGWGTTGSELVISTVQYNKEAGAYIVTLDGKVKEMDATIYWDTPQYHPLIRHASTDTQE